MLALTANIFRPFGIDQKTLNELHEDKNFVLLEDLGGVNGVARALKTMDVTDGWTDGAGIFFGVVFSILIVAIGEFWHNKILKASRNKTATMSKSSGDQVPAHGLLFDGPNSLQLELNKAKYDPGVDDEGIELNNLTGHDPFVFSGTKVVDGFARMVVTSVGMDAKGAQRTSKTNCGSGKETPLQLESQLKELNWITDSPLHGIVKINVIVGVLVGIITTVINIPDPWQLSLTFTRAYAMKKLTTTKNAMVLKPSSLENLGFANIICIDKTGVLTENKMQVDEFWLGKESMAKGTYLSSICPYVVELLREGIAC
ncbi:hypothetical protein TIFTF001_015973 [Ficus carica]|uniref:Uncharacterized protein n=1 Tax=Ficus carica TaxID=3494 RepID=A0AA88DIR5_FICCA|nr:hypothetical protein TIFTF001_015973 [Ficus carica]